MNATIRREFRVAFSRRAQPVWFRIAKWTCILSGVALFHDRRWFWWTLAGLAVAGTLLHLFYRWKTKTWTQAWGRLARSGSEPRLILGNAERGCSGDPQASCLRILAASLPPEGRFQAVC